MAPLTLYALADMGGATQNDWAMAYLTALEVRLDSLYTLQELNCRPRYIRLLSFLTYLRHVKALNKQQVILDDCRNYLDWNKVTVRDAYRICFQLERVESKLIKSVKLSRLIPAHD